MNAISLVISVRYRYLLLFLCCLLPAIAANAQTPTAQILWKHTFFTGALAYSPAEPLLAAAQGSGEVVLLHPDGAAVRTIPTARACPPSPLRRMDRRWLPVVRIGPSNSGAYMTAPACRPSMDQPWYTRPGLAPDGQTLASGSWIRRPAMEISRSNSGG